MLGGIPPRQQAAAETWAVGQAYEPYVGRWSRLVANEFVPWLAVPPGKRWLDIGSGTGALSQTIVERAAPVAVVCLDSSYRFLTHARVQAAPDSPVNYVVGDARTLPISNGSQDAVVSGLMLNFVPPDDQLAVVIAMRDIVRPGGVVSAYVWDYAGHMHMMRFFWDAATALDQAARDLDEGVRFSICKPGPLMSLLQRAGLARVEVQPIDVPTIFQDFDDFWTPFLGGQGPAPGYVKSLPEDRQIALRERLRATLPIRSDGSISLIARAWAVKGLRPSVLGNVQ